MVAIIVLTFGISTLPGCREDDQSDLPSAPPKSAAKIETEVMLTRYSELRSEADTKRAARSSLERKISILEETIHEMEIELSERNAMKEELQREIEKLAEKLKVESEDYIGTLKPVDEGFKRISDQIDRLQQENWDLRKQLEDAAK